MWDVVRIVVRRAVELVLRIWVVICHGRRIALPALLCAARGWCRSPLLLLLRLLWLRLLLLWLLLWLLLLLLLLLEPR